MTERESDRVGRWHYFCHAHFFYPFQIYVGVGTGSSKVLWLRRTFFRSCQLSNWSIPLHYFRSSVLFEFYSICGQYYILLSPRRCRIHPRPCKRRKKRWKGDWRKPQPGWYSWKRIWSESLRRACKRKLSWMGEFSSLFWELCLNKCIECVVILCRSTLRWVIQCVTNLFFSLKDRVKKLTTEKETLESHLKNEKDEKELYKVMSW